MPGVVAAWPMGILSLCVFCLRTYVAAQFMERGVAIAADWQAAVALFTHDFPLPLITPVWSAGLFVAADIVCAVLLILGAFMSSACAGLLMINAASLFFEPLLWDLTRPAPLLFRLYSSAALLMLLACGPGHLSFDALRKAGRRP
jgi:putative oxidoreductase